MKNHLNKLLSLVSLIVLTSCSFFESSSHIEALTMGAYLLEQGEYIEYSFNPFKDDIEVPLVGKGIYIFNSPVDEESCTLSAVELDYPDSLKPSLGKYIFELKCQQVYTYEDVFLNKEFTLHRLIYFYFLWTTLSTSNILVFSLSLLYDINLTELYSYAIQYETEVDESSNFSFPNYSVREESDLGHFSAEFEVPVFTQFANKTIAIFDEWVQSQGYQSLLKRS